DTFLHATSSVIGYNRHPTSERAGWWRARNDLIRKYIESHLGDQTLLPAQICNLFNLSRATLYRMFEDDGGVRRFIQDRRLHSAIWDLAEGGHAPRTFDPGLRKVGLLFKRELQSGGEDGVWNAARRLAE
ncbi:MAG: hypothetical protein VX599_00510, partial [Pseudomonadota bacterium]|nr:hypothetical protein [Pseudomonadota bacterium]